MGEIKKYPNENLNPTSECKPLFQSIENLIIPAENWINAVAVKLTISHRIYCAAMESVFLTKYHSFKHFSSICDP